MADDPRSDVVSDQYAHWIYPEPIIDLPSWLATNWQWFDPSDAHLSFWPDRGYRPDMRILVAGCGTNQAAVLAYTNPAATVVAIDVSRTSLDHHQYLKERYGLANLDLQLLPLEEAGALEGEFDLIISTGVLHHLAEPSRGAEVLAGLLAREGVLALMLYAKFGRIGVEMLQGVFRDLGLNQDHHSLARVREVIASVPTDHPVNSYIAIAPDLDFDAGLVDTFLHGRERSYTVEECLSLVTSAGLVFQEWFLKSPYEPHDSSSSELLASIAALPDSLRWSIMERINWRNSCHFFTACRPDRDPARYRISFDASAGSDLGRLVPKFRKHCRIDGHVVLRPGGPIALNAVQSLVLEQVDGERSIVQMAQQVEGLDSFRGLALPELQARIAAVVDSMWQRDVLVVRMV